MSDPKPARRKQEVTDAMNSHRGRILSVVNRMVRDQAEAEDVLQDVFEEFVEVYDLGETIESVGAWLVRVAQNKVVDRFRRRKTQQEYRQLVATDSEAEDTSDPEADLINQRLRSEIAEALETLPDDQRDVFIKHELEGKSFEEISAATGVSVNTLLSRKRYAVQALRNYLKEVYDELSR